MATKSYVVKNAHALATHKSSKMIQSTNSSTWPTEKIKNALAPKERHVCIYIIKWICIMHRNVMIKNGKRKIKMMMI